MKTARGSTNRIVEAVRRHAVPWLDGQSSGGVPLQELVGAARMILLGEASHGTHEFYARRARLTQGLIVGGRCQAVAVEADWPDAYRVNRYVQGRGSDATAEAALGDFQRFPQWMWRNTDVVDFVAWLREFNQGRPLEQRVGFYGLDLYSLFTSIAAVIAYLKRVDPAAAREAQARYACFEEHRDDPQGYGLAAHAGAACEDEAVAQLVELRAQRHEYLARDGVLAQDEQFAAEQNAHLVKNAENYYRGMFGGRANTWNVRDQHMAETLSGLATHLAHRCADPRIIVWAHNSHLGDARATEMTERGELNLGQLVREQWGDAAFNLGFTTFDGTVAAASDWGEPVELKSVRPALPDSFEALLHESSAQDFWLNLRDPELRVALGGERLERAIGVIYRPHTERHSHYFFARLSAQFDALIHCDHTRAVQPLERAPTQDVPAPEEETYPSGI